MKGGFCGVDGVEMMCRTFDIVGQEGHFGHVLSKLATDLLI